VPLPMSQAPNLPSIERGQPHKHGPRGLPMLALISLIVGGMTGLVCGAFHALLDDGDILRNKLLVQMHASNWAGLPCFVLICATATAMAAWLVRRYAPIATGSGIPHVEAVLKGDLPPAQPRLLIIKFIGGLLALGAGLALGREGPSVQMGATISHVVGKIFKRNAHDCLLLLAAGAGAGLAVAFNAPIAGAVFVLEELTRRFDTRTTVVTFGASAAAISTGRTVFGDAPDFVVHPLPPSAFGCLAFSLVLGALAGILGIAYNRSILGALALAKRVPWPVEARAAVIGASVGLLAWFAPSLVGGGDQLTQQALLGTAGTGVLIGTFLLRFALGPVSYAAGTPGGLFAPMLVLGAQSGLLFGNVAHAWFPALVTDPITYAVTGIAAFFAAVVRAPLTGIILAIELTGSYTQLLPMLAACFTAMLIPTLVGNSPIYDSLKAKK
jgi:CIC family chloride channel protein